MDLTALTGHIFELWLDRINSVTVCSEDNMIGITVILLLKDLIRMEGRKDSRFFGDFQSPDF